MGEEIGMTNTPIPPARALDPMARRLRALPQLLYRALERVIRESINRDEVRSPMQWDIGANAGFCPPGVQPWLPVNRNHRERSVAAQADDPDSLLSLNRRLLELRRTRPALSEGSLELLPGLPREVLGYRRRAGSDAVAVYLNFSARPREIAPAPAAAGQVLLSTAPGNRAEGNRIVLQPDSAAIVNVGPRPARVAG
jgi:alpha-glucosidase